MADDVVEILKQASAGLMYPSESDSPFDVFVWDGKGKSGKDAVVKRVGKGKKVEEVGVDDFFAELAGADGEEGFKKLQGVLKEQLAGVTVVRVGAVRVDVYVVGKAKLGVWAGVHTVSVET